MNASVDPNDGLEACFDRISALMGEISGVQLPGNKVGLVRSRLRKRLRPTGTRNFAEYLDLVESPAGTEELSTMVDLLTTNKTSFFRESAHFQYLVEHVLPSVDAGLRIWCAGCSSGEEPYTVGMVIRGHLPDAVTDRTRILATDLSNRVLTIAREGVYVADAVRDVPPELGSRFFGPAEPRNGRPTVRISEEVRRMVRFARLNLMRRWPMRGPFDAIFCRNVMIYFDAPTRERLVQRYSRLLAPGGHLFVGHSEGLNNLRHDLQYVQPATYRKAS